MRCDHGVFPAKEGAKGLEKFSYKLRPVLGEEEVEDIVCYDPMVQESRCSL